MSVDVQRITLNESCMTISGGRTKQLDIFCRVTGFMSDFLSCIVVEFIRFFHGAIQMIGYNNLHSDIPPPKKKILLHFTANQKLFLFNLQISPIHLNSLLPSFLNVYPKINTINNTGTQKLNVK